MQSAANSFIDLIFTDVDATLSNKVCNYINDNFRSKYKTNYEFAAAASIDEKTVRQIAKGKISISLVTLKKICDSQKIKMSTVLKAIEE